MSVTAVLDRLARWLLVAIGISVFAVGLFIVFVPGTGEHLPMEALVEALGSDYIVVAVFGIGAIGFALFVTLFRRLTGINEAITPVVEGIQSAPFPGASFDRSNGRLFGVWVPSTTRSRLRDVAIRTLMRSEGCSRSTAEHRVEAGSWTDDAVAASLVRDVDSGGMFGINSQVERTVEAIDAVDAGETRTTADGSSGENSLGVERRTRGATSESRVGTDDNTSKPRIDSDSRRTERERGTAPGSGN